MGKVPVATTQPRGLPATASIHWEMVPADELFELVYGKALVASARNPGSVPVYGTNGRCGWHDQAIFDAPGVVLGRKGQGPLGVEWVSEDYWVIDTAYSLRPKRTDIDLKFFYYLIKHIGLNHLKDGTSNPTLSRDAFGRQAFPFPPESEQRAIAATLGALDDKIELNRQMNATLEETVRALFRDWFVDFGPTRAKMAGAQPYLAPEIWDLFPDRLDVDGRPEGWNSFRLQDIATHHKKSVSPAGHPEEIFEHYSLPAFDKGQDPACDLGSSIKSNKTLVPAKCVLLSKLNPEIPRVWMTDEKQERTQIASTEFLAFTGKAPAGRDLLFCLFGDPGFREMMESMVTGTSKSHQRVSPRQLLEREVIVGEEKVFKTFETQVDPCLQMIRSNRREARSLAETRDYLLPRLMSGEVRADSDAERVV